MKYNSRFFEVSLLTLTVAAVCGAGAACSTSDAGDDSASGGSGNAAGTTSTSGGTSAGATSGAGTSSIAGTSGSVAGSGAGGGGAVGVACPKATLALLTDFSPVDGGGDPGTFGDFTTTFSGSTFVFPGAAQTPTPMYPITSDLTGGNWHLTGTVGDYSGFGLVFANCNEVDLSMFSGISFTVKGTVAAPAAAANSLTLSVGTAADDVASTWLNSHKTDATAADVAANFGRCMPTTNQYDGTCGSPSFKVPVTATATTVTVKWTDLIGGKPSASVNPMEITSIVWVIPPPNGAGTAAPTTYDIDVTLDDLQFVP